MAFTCPSCMTRAVQKLATALLPDPQLTFEGLQGRLPFRHEPIEVPGVLDDGSLNPNVPVGDPPPEVLYGTCCGDEAW